MLCDGCISKDVCKYVREFENIRLDTPHPYAKIICMKYQTDKKYISIKDKIEFIKDWRLKHPHGTKMECHKDTHISRPTIDKYWE